MALLNAFVANYVPLEFRHGRDFTGGRGWVDLTNQFLRKLERNGILKIDRKKETGVEVENDYWIDFPSDCRRVVEIYYPPLLNTSESELKYGFEIMNGKIKLHIPFDKKASPDSFTLSSGSTTQITINDDDAAANEWENYLLVPTNGTYQTPIIIGEHDAASANVTVLNFLHTQPNTINSTAGYLTDQYLMLVYESTYTAMSAANGEIPIDDRYEMALANWLTWQAIPLGDKRRIEAKRDFLETYEELTIELTTLAPDQIRGQSRPMAAFEDCTDFDQSEFEYIGDDND
jgi:hypothetical protein